MKDLILQIWQFILEHQAEFIIGLIITIICALVIALFRNLLRKLWRAIFGTSEEKKEQDRKLRVHFEELRKEAEPVISFARDLENVYGAIGINEKSVVGTF